MPTEIIEVVAYSGYRGEEYPRLFIMQGERIDVLAILSIWTDENIKDKKRKRFFGIRGSDGYEYKMYHDEEEMQWFLIRE
jgi:hypothetical protein